MKNNNSEKLTRWQKFIIFVSFVVGCSITYCSGMAIKNHSRLVETRVVLDKKIEENANLRKELGQLYHELGETKSRLVKMEKQVKNKGTASTSTSRLVCGKPGTIAQKLNNPFNIKRRYDGGKWKGEIGHDSQGHVHFIDVEHGIRAAAYVLKSYYKKHNISTLESIIDRFCGGNDDYVRFLSHRLKLRPDEKFNVMRRLPELLQAMSKYESGKELPDECLVTLDLAREL